MMAAALSVEVAVKLLERLGLESGLEPPTLGDGFAEYTINLEGGRKQTVVCRVGMVEGEPKYFVFESLAAPANSDTYEKMLIINARSDFGVVGLRKHQGHDYYCVSSAQLIAECDAAEVRGPVEAIAAMADAIEAELVGTDEH
jgi:hypothetical protein